MDRPFDPDDPHRPTTSVAKHVAPDRLSQAAEIKTTFNAKVNAPSPEKREERLRDPAHAPGAKPEPKPNMPGAEAADRAAFDERQARMRAHYAALMKEHQAAREREAKQLEQQRNRDDRSK